MTEFNKQEYPHLPIISPLLRIKIDLGEIPEEFNAVRSRDSDSRTVHFIRKKSFASTEKNTEKDLSFCGCWISYREIRTNPVTYDICPDCAEILDNKLQKYLYDVEKEEWYHVQI